MSDMSKPKPKASFALYLTVAVFVFILSAALLENQPEFHRSPFGLIIMSGIIAHLVSYFGLSALVAIGILQNTDG